MKVTVFTPLYNRKKEIVRLYESLKKQKCEPFQWVVVDDGSSDHPEELFAAWVKEDNNFEIEFVQTPNGGKHRAINRGVKLAKGEYFLICDSDDYLTDDALEHLDAWIDEVRGLNLVGVAGLKRTEDGRFLLWVKDENGNTDKYGGKPSFTGYIDATVSEGFEYGLYGDKAEAYRTDVLRNYPFPEFEGENFLVEPVVWSRIERDGGKVRWYDSPIEVGSYQDGGLTDQGHDKYIRNPKGYGVYIREFEEEARPHFFQMYYEELQDVLTDAEIAENLGLEDCAEIKAGLIEKKQIRLREVSVMKESIALLDGIRAQMRANPENREIKENYLFNQTMVRQLLNSVIADKDEVELVVTTDGELLMTSINQIEETLNAQIKRLMEVRS